MVCPSFLKNEFLIDSPAQIAKILEAGIPEVSVDMDRSRIQTEESRIKNLSKTVKVPQPIIPPDLREAIYDKKMPAAKRAQAIHHHSTVMIQRLMESPSMETIQDAKKGDIGNCRRIGYFLIQNHFKKV